MPARQDGSGLRSDTAVRFGGERLPRYTSYPTAPHFSAAVSHETYSAWLAATPRGVSGSLYVHVPFCRSMCWYCGCHTTITRREAPIIDYLAVLRREIELVADKLPRMVPVGHLHFGGGTPTLMTPEAFLDLVGLLKARFSFAADATIAVEIDPRTLSRAMAASLAAAGVTRASLGVQSFDPIVQLAVNRIQTFDVVADATVALREAGISGVNFDLIYGLPHQTAESCVDTVRRCLVLRPDRFAVFGYAHVPAFKKHQRRIDETALADGAGRLAQARAIATELRAEGYVPIGFDHFARPDDDMAKAQATGRLHRNFQGYTTDAGDVLIGFGASAIGRLVQGYVQNEVALPRYAERVGKGELATVKGHALTPEDRLRAEIIERLMCDLRVDIDDVSRRHGLPSDTLAPARPKLAELAAEGLARVDGPVVSVPEKARLLVRTTASAFDAYLGASSRPYSRAV